MSPSITSRGSRNAVIAGTFVVVSIVLTFVIIIVLADARERLTPTARYTIRFSLADGAEGLKNGSNVKVGGQKVGRVTAVRFVLDEAVGSAVGVDVDVRVRSDIQLFEDAIVNLQLPLLGSVSEVNIPFPGTGRAVTSPQGGDPRLADGERLMGSIAPPAFLGQAGFGPEQREQVQAIIRNGAEASDRIRAIAERVDKELEPAVSRIQATLEDARAVAADVRAKAPDWTRRIDSTLTNADETAAKLNSGAEDARAAVRSVKEIIDGARERVTNFLASAESFARKLDTETYAGIMQAIERGRDGLDRFADAAEQADTFLREQAPELRGIIANARLASDQLKLTMIEVRRNPWRILYQPTRRELEQELLYDAARSYATAVSDLRAAAEALDGVGTPEGEALTDTDRAAVAGQLQHIREAFDRYKTAEQDFLNRLAERPAK